MKRIPTFVSDDNGSIIHIIKKTIKNYSSPLKTQFQRISWKKRMEPEALHTRKTILTS